MPVYILAFLIGVTSGLRALTPLAAVSGAARLGCLHLENTWLSFLGAAIAPYIFSALAIGELIYDKLPHAPSRKAPPGFISRIVVGALCGAAVGASGGALPGGLVAGVLGALAGTLGGYEARKRAAAAVGKDLPIALIEDAIAVGGAFWIVSR